MLYVIPLGIEYPSLPVLTDTCDLDKKVWVGPCINVCDIGCSIAICLYIFNVISPFIINQPKHKNVVMSQLAPPYAINQI